MDMTIFGNNLNKNDNGELHSNMNGIDLSNKKCNKEIDLTEEVASDDKQPVKENNTIKKNTSTPNSTGKAKKRKKCLKDAKAPKQPLTGYFRFLNDRRDKVRNENPTMPFPEITKQLASEWNVLPTDEKKPYLDAAELDKERYNREMNDYKQTDAYKLFLQKQQSDAKKKELKKEKNGTDNSNNSLALNSSSTTPTVSARKKESVKGVTDEIGTFEIPIFTEEFLDHNKACEAELRQLRKSTMDYESQNAVLQRHVESLRLAVTRLETDTSNHETTSQELKKYLDNLRSQLISSFSNIHVPGTHQGVNLQNIDKFVDTLDNLANGSIDPTLRSNLRNAVARLEIIK